jgi:hypothetical protein
MIHASVQMGESLPVFTGNMELGQNLTTAAMEGPGSRRQS